MKKVNVLVDELQGFIDRVIGEAEAPVRRVLKFVKRNRRLIFIVVLTYLSFKYLFGTGREEYDYDEE